MSLIKLIAEGKLTEAEDNFTNQLDNAAAFLVEDYKEAAFKSLFEEFSIELVEDEEDEEDDEVTVSDEDDMSDEDDLEEGEFPAKKKSAKNDSSDDEEESDEDEEGEE